MKCIPTPNFDESNRTEDTRIEVRIDFADDEVENAANGITWLSRKFLQGWDDVPLTIGW